MVSITDNDFDNDIIMSVASYLEATDLLSLALSCKRFGSKKGTANDREYRKMKRDAKRHKVGKDNILEWSLLEEAARCIVKRGGQTSPNYEGALPLFEGESWIHRLHQLQALSKPLTFDQLVGCGSGWSMETKIFASSDRTTAGTSSRGYYLACSNCVMRGGKHFVNFTLGGWGTFVRVGVMRPIKNCNEKGISTLSLTGSHDALLREKNERWGDGIVNKCNYNMHDGVCQWSDWDKHPHPEYYRRNPTDPVPHCHDIFKVRWTGMEGCKKDDVAGLLLDLDEGTLTVYKNGRLLGLMQDGLNGEYCWAVDIYCGFEDAPSVKIERGNIPV